MVLTHLSHAEGGFGVTFNDITKGSRSASSPLPPTSVLRTELTDLEPQEDAPKRVLWYTPMSWLGVIRPHRRLGVIRPHSRDRDESWSASFFQTFFALAVGAQIPAIVSLPAKKFKLDAYCCPFSLDRSACPSCCSHIPTNFFLFSPLARISTRCCPTHFQAHSTCSIILIFAGVCDANSSLSHVAAHFESRNGRRRGASNPASMGQMHCIAAAIPPEAFFIDSQRLKAWDLDRQDLMGKRLRLCASASFKACPKKHEVI
jgi:hypothetical protein